MNEPVRIKDSNYFIDTNGNVYSNFNKSGRAKIPFRILSPNLRNGYPSVRIDLGECIKHHTIHRLSAITFLENPNNYDQVNHINGIKTDNRLENLEWSNASLNMIHAYKNGLMIAPANRKGFKGELCPSSIPVIQKDSLGKMIKKYVSLTSCREDGFNPISVSRNCKGLTNLYKGYKWIFETENNEPKYKLENVLV